MDTLSRPGLGDLDLGSQPNHPESLRSRWRIDDLKRGLRELNVVPLIVLAGQHRMYHADFA